MARAVNERKPAAKGQLRSKRPIAACKQLAPGRDYRRKNDVSVDAADAASGLAGAGCAAGVGAGSSRFDERLEE